MLKSQAFLYLLTAFLFASPLAAVSPSDNDAMKAVVDFYGSFTGYPKFKAAWEAEWSYDDVSRPTEATRTYRIQYEKMSDGAALTLWGVIVYQVVDGRWKHAYTRGTTSKVEGLAIPKTEELAKIVLAEIAAKPERAGPLQKAVYISNILVDQYGDGIETGFRIDEKQNRLFTLSFYVFAYGAYFKEYTAMSSRGNREYAILYEATCVFRAVAVREKNSDPWRMESLGPTLPNLWRETTPDALRDVEFSRKIVFAAGVKTLSNSGLSAVYRIPEAQYQKMIDGLRKSSEEEAAQRIAAQKQLEDDLKKRLKERQTEFDKLLVAGKWDGFRSFASPTAKTGVDAEIKSASESKTYKILGSAIEGEPKLDRLDAGVYRGELTVTRQFEKFKKQGPLLLSAGKSSKEIKVRWRYEPASSNWFIEGWSSAFSPL